MVLVHINSLDRVSGTNNKFGITLDPILANIKTGRRVKVKSVEVPFSFYTVRNGYNNSFTYTDSNLNSKTIYLTGSTQDGTISSTQLITNVLAQLNINTDSCVWTITVSTVTAKLTITATRNSLWQFDKDPKVQAIFGILETDTGVNFVANIPKTLAYPINLSPYRYVYVNSSLRLTSGLDYDSYLKGSGTIIAKVPMNVNGFNNIYYEPQEAVHRGVQDFSGVIEFWVTDREGKIIDLNNVPWSLTLELDRQQ